MLILRLFIFVYLLRLHFLIRINGHDSTHTGSCFGFNISGHVDSEYRAVWAPGSTGFFSPGVSVIHDFFDKTLPQVNKTQIPWSIKLLEIKTEIKVMEDFFFFF